MPKTILRTILVIPIYDLSSEVHFYLAGIASGQVKFLIYWSHIACTKNMWISCRRQCWHPKLINQDTGCHAMDAALPDLNQAAVM